MFQAVRLNSRFYPDEQAQRSLSARGYLRRNSAWACASFGGVFDNYSIVQGCDQVVPIDVFVPGCPPRPEALMDGFIALQNKIMEERNRVG